jgi:anti-anti-sigma factor
VKSFAGTRAPFFVIPFDDGRGVRLVGELDLSTVGVLAAALDTLPVGVLDLAELTFMDASGLHALEQYAGTLNGSRPLVLANVSPQIRRLFEITGAEHDPDIELRNRAGDG